MNLFSKNETAKSACCGDCIGETIQKSAATKAEEAVVKVLGSGCTKCNQLEAAVKEALVELGLSTAIDHVTDFSQIAAYGVMTTPALVVNGKVVSYGKVLKKNEVIALFQRAGIS